jgi:Fe-S cluster assembly protein SufD
MPGGQPTPIQPELRDTFIMSQTSLQVTARQALPGFDEAAFTGMPAREPALLATKREQAFARYLELPNPTARDEEFRRTDPDTFQFGRFQRSPVFAVNPAEVHADWEENFDVVIAVGNKFTHVEDRTGLVGKGLTVCPLSEAAEKHPEWLATYLHGSALPDKPRKFLEMNTAFFNVGFLIHVAKGVKVPHGILISYTGQDSGSALLPRVVVIAEEGSEFTLAEHFQSDDDASFLCLSAREFYVDPGAHVKLVSVQEWGKNVIHIGEDWARVRRDATVDLFTMTLGGKVSKMSVGCDVCERNANAYLGGLYFAHARQHFDQLTLQMHSSPDTFSKMLYKGAAKDRGYSVYQGIIRATTGSIGVDAYQTNNNLILDPTARTDSIPGLIIDADELACSHGATIGNLDPEQLYYLRSRGIPLQEARRLLVVGFFEEIVERVPYETVRELLHGAIERKLAG